MSAQELGQERSVNVHHKRVSALAFKKKGQTTQRRAVSGKINWTEAGLRMRGNAGRPLDASLLN